MCVMCVIHRESDVSESRINYWRRLAGTGNYDVVDPFRTPLLELRQIYPSGTRVYRAATGGRWSCVVTL